MAVQPEAASGRPETPDFFFLVIPGEDTLLREARWNKVINNLQSSGQTILGVGPDLDWPVRYELADDNNPFGPFYEIFHVVTLEESARLTAEGHDCEEVSA